MSVLSKVCCYILWALKQDNPLSLPQLSKSVVSVAASRLPLSMRNPRFRLTSRFDFNTLTFVSLCLDCCIVEEC